MSRTTYLLVFSFVLCGFTCTACAKNAKYPETTDPAEAAKDPDFKIQGEYVGAGTWKGQANVKVGAQVIALSKGAFTVVVTKGGLPGDGWRRGDERFNMQGKPQSVESAVPFTALSGKDVSGSIEGDVMTLASGDGTTKLELKRTVRHSSTEGAKPAAGAAVLFDGTTAEQFEHGVLLPNKSLLSGNVTKRKFGDYTLHVEFRLSYMPTARGQARSNSGVYLHDCYEIQVLDSFGLEGEDNECGGIYKQRKPDVNLCYPPLAWQTYDVEFTAPRYEDGKKVANAKMEVRHNGVVIHPTFELTDATPGRQKEGPGPRPIHFQGHGNKVEYRNIWVKPAN
jgi:hypothetical protein